jgi:hypothetical protein
MCGKSCDINKFLTLQRALKFYVSKKLINHTFNSSFYLLYIYVYIYTLYIYIYIYIESNMNYKEFRNKMTCQSAKFDIKNNRSCHRNRCAFSIFYPSAVMLALCNSTLYFVYDDLTLA